jgi:hypothetical protein
VALEGRKGEVSRSIAQCNRNLAINLLIRHMFGFNNKNITPCECGRRGCIHTYIIGVVNLLTK